MPFATAGTALKLAYKVLNSSLGALFQFPQGTCAQEGNLNAVGIISGF